MTLFVCFFSQDLVVQRLDIAARRAVHCVGVTAGMFNIILSGFRSFNCTSEYRYI